MAATLPLTVVQHHRHEVIRVEGHQAHDGQAEEPRAPPQTPKRVRKRQYCGPHYRRRQMEPRVPPLPCIFLETAYVIRKKNKIN